MNTTDDCVHDVTAHPYNAAGSGHINDRDAIQAAIDAASSSGSGTVLLPAGNVFLSGNLFLKSDVTLRIEGTLRQSQDPAHLTFAPLLGHRKPGAHPSHITWFDNLPFLFARRCHNVTLTGSGTIELTHAAEDALEFSGRTPDSPSPITYLPAKGLPQRGIGTDHHTIHLVPIALYEVDGFEVSGLNLFYGNTHNILIYSCRNGTVRDTTVAVYPTVKSYGRHHVGNTDAVQVQNSQNVRIAGNRFDQIDNTVVIVARHADPRERTAWWSTTDPQPTTNIEIDHNMIKTSHGGVVFLPWAPGATDLSQVEISDVRIHHNTFDVGIQPLQIRDDYVYDPGPDHNNHSPIKNVTIHDNVYAHIERHSRRLTRRARITNLIDDFGQLSHPTFVNGSFQHKLAYWSVRGAAGCLDGGASDVLPSDAARAMAGEVRGPIGYLYDLQHTSALYQGLGLVDGLRYRLRARVASSGSPVRLFVRNTCDDVVLAEQATDQPGWQDYELTFRAEGTCASYHVGLDRGSARKGWALVDWMRLDRLGETIEVDDPRIAYTGDWCTQRDVNLVGNSYVESTEVGAAATLTFDGTRARWFGLRDWVYGRADAWIDDESVESVDGFNAGAWPAWVDHQVLLDTGPLTPGRHTVRLACSADPRPGSLGVGIALDAVVVDR